MRQIEQLWKNRSYVVLGVPFYNETKTRRDFEQELNALIDEPVRTCPTDH